MTAQTLAVDANNDIYLGEDGNIALIFDLQGTLQACAHAAKTILGEMIFQANQGLPNFQLIWVGVPNTQQYEAAVRATLLEVAGVQEIVSFTYNLTDNNLTYTAVIKTIYGTGTVNG